MVLKKRNKKELIKVIGLLLITASSFYLIYRYYGIRKDKINNQKKIDDFFIKEEKIPNNDEINIDDNKQQNNNYYSYDYIAILEIPKINLKRGLFNLDSNYNNIRYNIKILDESDMPNTEHGNFIVAGHNGASYISYFKNLDQLNIGDSIYIYYDNYKYEYKINDIYEVNKNGKVTIKRDNEQTTITLITCKKNSDDLQVVYIGYLDNKHTY